jgi:hypothetical protein
VLTGIELAPRHAARTVLDAPREAFSEVIEVSARGVARVVLGPM